MGEKRTQPYCNLDCPVTHEDAENINDRLDRGAEFMKKTAKATITNRWIYIGLFCLDILIRISTWAIS